MPMTFPGNTLPDAVEGLDASNMLDLSQFNKMRELATDRESQYRVFDEMEHDSIIAAALELYADDATQYNAYGKVIWAESDTPDIASFANRLIDAFHLNQTAWGHIYNLVKYGDVYLETFDDCDMIVNDPLSKSYGDTFTVKKSAKGSRLREYISMVHNPAEVYDLQKFGKCVGYVRVPLDSSNSGQSEYNYQHIQQGIDTQILPPSKFIHIMLNEASERFPETLSITFNEEGQVDLDTELDCFTYDIKRGKSILKDVYKVWKEISFMEDSLLLNRVTRSSIIRLLQVEVGDMPKNQARDLLKRVKMLIEQKNFMDKGTGQYVSMASPGPVDNVIYVPTHNGIGAIQSSNLGGDVDVKSIADLDFFKNKLYGGLKIPKQFLGDTDDAAGFSGGSSLTKLDARYARTIKRIQNQYIQGIQTLINLFAINKGLIDYVNEFQIKMTEPNTTEEADRTETISSKLSNANDLYSFVAEHMSQKGQKDLIVSLLSNMVGVPEIADIVDKDEMETEEAPMEGGDFGGGGFGGGGGFDDMPGGDFGGDGGFADDLGGGEELGGEEAGGGFEEAGGGGAEEFGDFESVMDNDEEYV